MDDARSPLEASSGGEDVSAPFGQLMVADAEGLGLPPEALQQLSSSQQRELTAHDAGLEADLQIWRQYLAEQGSYPGSVGELIFVPFTAIGHVTCRMAYWLCFHIRCPPPEKMLLLGVSD